LPWSTPALEFHNLACEHGLGQVKWHGLQAHFPGKVWLVMGVGADGMVSMKPLVTVRNPEAHLCPKVVAGDDPFTHIVLEGKANAHP